MGRPSVKKQNVPVSPSNHIVATSLSPYNAISRQNRNGQMVTLFNGPLGMHIIRDGPSRHKKVEFLNSFPADIPAITC